MGTVNFKKGFTLLELILAIFLFSVVFTIVSVLFVSAIRNQIQILNNQKIVREMSFVLEYISRALRMAQKDDIGGIDCLTGYKANFETTTLGIKFRNYKNECQQFLLENHRLKEIKRDGISGVTTSEGFLTSPDLYIEKFKISLLGEKQPPGDYLQPRITISLIVRMPNKKSPKMNLQTTISQRNLDMER